MHSVLARQIERSRQKDGTVDLAKLVAFVTETYNEADSERRRTDHTIRMMIEELDHRAEHDAMTGLANRARFTAELQKAIGAPDAPRRAAVLFIDLDRFKTVNDTMGHFAGDDLLRQVARRLRETVGDRGVSARLGGDEFAVLQWNSEVTADAAVLASDIIAVLSTPFDIEGKRVSIGASVGIALSPDHGRAINDLQRRADMALYRAKQSSRGTFCFFDKQMDEALTSRKALELDLRNALIADHFQLFFQPIVEARTNRIKTYEALIRWVDPVRGVIPPDEFIPVAEECGLIVPIGEWVIRNACVQALRFPADVGIAINISPAQLKSESIVDVFRSALEATGLDPTRLDIEITETVLLAEDERTIRLLNELRKLGLRFSLDDFGTGYSSLSYLQKFKFDKIKIDRSFCASVHSNPTNASLVRAIASLGRDLGIDVVAEGVESVQESTALTNEGCGYLQGFYFGRPTAAENLMGMAEIAAERARELLKKIKSASSTPVYTLPRGRRRVPFTARAS